MRSGVRRAIGTGAVAAILAATLLAWSAWEARTQRRVLDALARSQGAAFAEALGHAVENADVSEREIGDLAAARLLDLARLVERLDSVRPLDPGALASLRGELGLRRLDLLPTDASGLPPSFAAVARGDADLAVLGPDPSSPAPGYAAAVRRRAGGAVVAGMDADEMEVFRERTGAEHLLRSVGGTGGIVYAILEDPDGRERVVEPVEGPRRDRAMEFVRPVDFGGGHSGRLRVGLADDARVAAARAAVRRTAVASAVAFALAAAALVALAARARLERERRRSASLEAFGRLAAQVAHEVRNPLNAISLVAQRLRREFRPERDTEEFDRLTSLARDEIARLDAIVTRFLEAARPPALEPSPLDLAELVRNCRPLLEDGGGAAPAALDLRPVWAQVDPGAIRQILLNLVRNARESSGAPVRVTIATRRAGRRALLEVADDGPGVPGPEREKVFEFGYTTKGRGSGLGLPTVRRLVEELGGSVELDEAPGGGTRARVTFPALEHPGGGGDA